MGKLEQRDRLVRRQLSKFGQRNAFRAIGEAVDGADLLLRKLDVVDRLDAFHSPIVRLVSGLVAPSSSRPRVVVIAELVVFQQLLVHGNERPELRPLVLHHADHPGGRRLARARLLGRRRGPELHHDPPLADLRPRRGDGAGIIRSIRQQRDRSVGPRAALVVDGHVAVLSTHGQDLPRSIGIVDSVVVQGRGRDYGVGYSADQL
mmetsp:Transcript_56046/g.119188  ORF Transcript_56046/g.119188 Transcript_56046/m.119188 type:complete len:205 (+) Transcript_56046:1807-2421(+)